MTQAPTSALPDETFFKVRTDTYALLAALLFRAPDPQLHLQLQNLQWPADMRAELVEGWNGVREAARKYRQQAIENEFQAIFVGLGKGEVVPYASWYKQGLLMAVPLVHLRRDLAELGLSRRPEAHEPEDHAALLCETMALLAQSREVDGGAYARFFQRHVAPWMFAFFTDLGNAPSAGFYRAVAELGRYLLDAERHHRIADGPTREANSATDGI